MDTTNNISAHRLANLKKGVMRRIWMVWGIRMALHPRTLKALVVLVVFARTTDNVSYVNVIHNAPSLLDLRAGLNFAQAALAQTETTTFALLSIMTVFVAWIAFDMAYRECEAW